ncbi:MAG: response regulator, partial [Desulfovibrionaceae bacterium]
AADHCFDIYFTVEDTGIGMDTHTLARVFESFTIGEHFMTKRHSGAGVGLTIVRNLVEMLGGTIQASSTPGEGTSVTFHLPFRPPTEQEAEQDAAPVLPEGTEPRTLSPNANAHILVVEDDPVNMLAVEAVLRRGGFTVDKACNGAEALEALRLHPADLVLMDIQMPVMDGLRATSHIRNGEVPGVDRRIPVIALTAYATPGNIDRFQRWGIDDVIAKPFVSSHLKDVLLRHLSG